MNRKRLIWILAATIIVVFLILQLIPNHLPENIDSTEHDIISAGLAEGEVANILKESCYDCHSNKSVYPWYSYVAPVSWLIAHDVEEGRHELNFSEWTSFEKKRQLRKLEEIADEVGEGEMPLGIYTALHGEAKLSEEQRNLIVNWANELKALVGRQ